LADYRYFYVESRSADDWVVPSNLAPWGGNYNAELGAFLWAHPRQRWLDLFAIGRYVVEPLFRLRPGPPDDRRASSLLRYLDNVHHYDYAKNDYHLAWMPYEELFVDCWDTETVVLGGNVPAQYALLFGNGEQPFPTAELVTAGVEEKALERFHNGWWTDKSADMTFGPDRYHLNQLPPDRDVWVTRRETIAGFIGAPHADEFRGLRRYGRDEDLRVLSMWG
jgi:hypothetical protein